jgi:hypothetical protein
MMMVIKNPSLATTALVLQIVQPSLRQLRCFIVMDHVVMTGWIMYTDVNKLTLMLIVTVFFEFRLVKFKIQNYTK